MHPSEFGHDKADPPEVTKQNEKETKIAKYIIEKRNQKEITKGNNQKLNQIQKEARGEDKEKAINHLANATSERRKEAQQLMAEAIMTNVDYRAHLEQRINNAEQGRWKTHPHLRVRRKRHLETNPSAP